MDPATIGRKIKQQYPDYKDINDAQLGTKFMLKHGDKGLSALGIDPSVEAQKAKDVQDSAKTKSDLLKNAQTILDVIDKGKTGKLQGQAYKDALDYAASEYAGNKGFEKGGKALTGPELTILGGAMPVIQQEGTPQWLKFLTGIEATQHGHVNEGVDTLERKMLIAQSQLQGKNVDPNEINRVSSDIRKPGITNILSNAGADAKDVLNGILGLPKTIAENAQHPEQIPNTLLNMGKGVVSEYDQALGQPLKGGDIFGRMQEHAVEHPVNTLLDVLPFLKVGQLAKSAQFGKAAETATVASKPVAPSALQKVLNIPGNVQQKVRSDIRNIDVGPSVYGADKEAKITNTLNQLGIKGSAADQYSQLHPKIAEIGDGIQQELTANPQSVPLTRIVQDFETNLSDQIRTKNMSTGAARSEVRGYLSDLQKISAHENIANGLVNKVIREPNSISTPDLFKMKQKVNKDYQGVAKKIDAGSTLNDRERVIAVARQTLDDIIAEKHPDVKEATTMQSHLYDAVEPLYNSRKKATGIGVKAYGNYIGTPVKPTQRLFDYLGRAKAKKSPINSPILNKILLPSAYTGRGNEQSY